MIDEVDARLVDWVGSVLGADVGVGLGPPGPGTPAGVNLYLLEIAPAPPPRGAAGAAALQFALRYLVTTWGDDARKAHALLGELLFAAMEAPGLEVDTLALPTEVWVALGAAPRPGFVLRVPVRREKPVARAPAVRELVTRYAPASPMVGRVLGPGDLPVAKAFVELPELRLVATTDAEGRFRFPMVPTEPRTRALRVRARGEVVPVQVSPAPGEEALIRITPRSTED